MLELLIQIRSYNNVITLKKKLNLSCSKSLQTHQSLLQLKAAQIGNVAYIQFIKDMTLILLANNCPKETISRLVLEWVQFYKHTKMTITMPFSCSRLLAKAGILDSSATKKDRVLEIHGTKSMRSLTKRWR